MTEFKSYHPQITDWFKTHDTSLANIMAISRKLEPKTGMEFEELNLAVVKLLYQENIMNRTQYKEFQNFIQSMKLNIDTFTLKRKRHRSAPMIFHI